MTNEEVEKIQDSCGLDELEKKTTTEIVNLIQSSYPNNFLTGTFAFGHTSFKDIDIVLCGYDKRLVATELKKNNFIVIENGGSIGSIVIENTKLNLICVWTKDIVHWEFATQIMKSIKPIFPKGKRHATFEILKGLSKMELELRKGLF